MPPEPEQALASLSKAASVLLMQSKKHQIFREKKQEAAKQAEAGAAFLKMAALVEQHKSLVEADVRDATLVMYYKAAATSLSRAKRLCRDLIRGKED